MPIYFTQFKVEPTQDNHHYDSIKGAYACCWVKEDCDSSAFVKAKFFVMKYDWNILDVETYPTLVEEVDFQNKDIGLELFNKAKKEGISFTFTGWTNNKETPFQTINLKQFFSIPISYHLKNFKRFSQKGRCLHFDKGRRCNEIIKAHSIQKNNSLSEISHNGHIYKADSSIGTLKNNNGRVVYRKYGINKVSTFLGFCKKHDNELFEPIDNSVLIPTDQQIALYAYRSLCRELFVSENALNSAKCNIEKGIPQEAISELMKGYVKGKSFGYQNLLKHKSDFDNTLSHGTYYDIRYVIFISKQNLTVAFSGLFYPDFDFSGRQLQDLSDQNSKLSLIAFFLHLLKMDGHMFSLGTKHHLMSVLSL